MIKFNHLWYLLHICCDFAIIVNPFFRAVTFSITGLESIVLYIRSSLYRGSLNPGSTVLSRAFIGPKHAL